MERNETKAMKKITYILIVILISQGLQAQQWTKYVIATNTTTTISFSYTSTAASGNTSSSAGALQTNFSADTTRNFVPCDIVNDPSAAPWRFSVKVGDCSGVLIDPYHVLTAGHVVDLSQGFGATKIIPAYNNSEMPYGNAYPTEVYLPATFAVGTAADYAIIKLDRPLGTLTGWVGYGYNEDDAFFRTNKFLNPSYPSAAPFEGKYLFNSKTIIDYVAADFLTAYRTGISGMSGSPAYNLFSSNYISYGILITTGVKFNRITKQKFDAINKIINDNTPALFDAIPLNTKCYPNNITNNTAPDSVTLIIHNYSSEVKSNAAITIDVYISTDSIITTADTKIKTYTSTNNYTAKGFQSIKVTGLSAISKTSGTYYIGAIISGDVNASNNTTSGNEVAKITVSTGNLFTISGRITSTQSGNGISGVQLTGFPQTVTTDFNGNYYARVTSGWSGLVTPVKTGFTFTSSSTTYTNVSAYAVTNYTTTKQIFTISGYAKSPVAKTGIWGVKMSGLPDEPFTNASGYYSVNVYYGWCGRVMPIKTNWKVIENLVDYTNITATTSFNLTCGLYITGFTYNCVGQRMSNIALSGFPVATVSDATGTYTAMLDSNWSGIVTASKGPVGFSPSTRTYTNIKTSSSLQSYSQLSAPVINVKLMLSGSYYNNSDTMTTVLNYKNILPVKPPDSLSGKTTPFVYVKKSWDTLSTSFYTSNRNIVDWVIIVVRDSTYAVKDTVAALLRKDGRVISIWGDTLIQLRPTTASGNYYISVYHRNHIAIMSANLVDLEYNTSLYDFTSGVSKYYGASAKLLKAGLYGMYVGDADRNGIVNTNDFDLYDKDSRFAKSGYINTDFNMDGFVTGTDFNLLIPNKKNQITTKIP